jgi:FMN phosphatase YigB (HAD superfamily)
MDREHADRLQELLASEANDRTILDLKDVTLVDRMATSLGQHGCSSRRSPSVSNGNGWHERGDGGGVMSEAASVVFLVDVDNTLLDNDRIQDDLKRHLEREFGPATRDRYWAILEALFVELGYRDYLGALQRYRVEHPHDVHLIAMSSYLVDYPFANRLYPGALDVLQRFRAWGPTVILSDGDVVFQPRKVERSGIAEAVDGHVLIYIHKEDMLDDIERRYPADHYVLVDDKPRILTAVKEAWGERVTTMFPRQGQYARDAKSYPPADLTVERIGDLVTHDVSELLSLEGPR